MTNFSQDSYKDDYNAFLFFENGEQIKVKACGRRGIFVGFLTIVNGVFSVAELQDCSNRYKFFITNENNIQIGDLKNEHHIVVIANCFSNYDIYKTNNVTFVTDLTPQIINNLLYKNNNIHCSCNNVKCILCFLNETSPISDVKKKELFQSLPENIYEIDFSNDLCSFRPQFLKNLYCERFNNFKLFSIFNNRKTVAVIDLLIQRRLLEILQKYFQVIILPYDEKYKDIKYLYEDRKIDGVILQNSLCNDLYFLNKKIVGNIEQLLNSKIPTLGIGNCAILMAEYFGSETKKDYNAVIEMDNYFVMNSIGKRYKVSNFCYKKIINLSQQLKSKYINQYGNIVGFQDYENNNLGYTFSFFSNNLDTAYFLNNFFNLISNSR